MVISLHVPVDLTQHPHHGTVHFGRLIPTGLTCDEIVMVISLHVPVDLTRHPHHGTVHFGRFFPQEVGLVS